MNLTFVGTGYVGLVTGTCFAEVGHNVICVDVDEKKIENLKKGQLPIYEPGLEDLVMSNQKEGRLSFTTDLSHALDNSDIIFVAVGTPQRKDGSADLQYVWTVVEQIRELAKESKVVVVKSTVPVGTNEEVQASLNEGSIKHTVASNPEFLREGLAIGDALNPDRVVIGTQDAEARETLAEMYRPFSDKGVPIVFMKLASAEMTKYVANCVLATKISYINEMANMCEAVGADINDVREGIGHDKRIGFRFFAPGVGYGGSCFPKDVRAAKSMARSLGVPMRIMEAIDYVNESQKRLAFRKLQETLGGRLEGANIAVWGLAFKPETDDIREAPSLVLIEQLLEAKANVRAYDPAAAENVRGVVGDDISYFEDRFEAAQNADALVVMTEWDEFRQVDLDKLRKTLEGNVVVDGRNIFDPQNMVDAGFIYSSVGRETVGANGDSKTILLQELETVQL